MSRLTVFNHVTLDGYFTDPKGDMSWAHRPDAEWTAYAEENARGDAILVFGRVTYQMMAAFWPTSAADAVSPATAKRMNGGSKIVYSRTMVAPSWSHTALVKGDLVSDMRSRKEEGGADMVILGSGSIVAQLAHEGLIDEYQLVVVPVILGAGRTLFEGVKGKPPLTHTRTRSFTNGNVLLCYEAA